MWQPHFLLYLIPEFDRRNIIYFVFLLYAFVRHCHPAGTAGRQLCRSTRLSARGLVAVSVYCATAAALGWQRSDSGSDYAVQLLLLKELHKAKKSVASAADFPVSMASDEEVIKSG